MNKIKISVRINPHNYEMIKAVADCFFFNERRNEGNLSKGLDLVLFLFRNNTRFKKMMELIECKSRYERGDRSRKVLQGMKEMEVLLKMGLDS